MAEQKKTTPKMKRRLMIPLLAIMMVALVYVTYTMYQVAIVDSETYQALANDQQFKTTTISANRGTIYDSNGQVLAQSVTVYTVYVDPRTFSERDTEQEDLIVETLSEYLDVDEDIIEEKLHKDNAYQVIATEVDKITATSILTIMSEAGVTSVGATATTERYYPQDDLAANVVGHLHYDGYGIYGIEASYDDYLTGTDGAIVTAIDANGSEIQYKYKQSYDAVDGNSVYSTIDATIQYYVEEALANAVEANDPENGACAIVMNCKTGAVYAMASSPTYNLNEPSVVTDESLSEYLAGLSDTATDEEYSAALSESLYTQWTNKAISSIYFPGSVFKVVTGSAALEENAITLSDTFYCSGTITVADTLYHCWSYATSGAHGSQTFAEAMTNSCNPAFVQIGQKLGMEAFSKYFEAFGFTQKTGIDLPAESNSLYIDADSMTLVNLASSSFGQANKVTPIQMICAFAAVVNGGYLLTPYVVDKVVDAEGNIVMQNETTVKRQVISEETSETMREVLETVVNTNSGSNAYIKGYSIGGKSGTSQKLDEDSSGTTYVSSYVAFYPADDPEIIMLVMVDHPTNGLYYGSAVAAPVVVEALTDILPYLGYYAEYTEEDLEDMDVSVPYIRGSTVEQATATLEALGLEIEVIGEGDTVIRQVPSSGSTMPTGCTVVVYTDEDYDVQYTTVPDISGCSLSEANRLLTRAGLNLLPLGGAAEKSGAVCSGTSNYTVGTTVEVGTIIEAYFVVNEDSG
ncbi:MAG: PASTA domain-containing protein [Oscillospiraceae bacterium]|nr:PASTA domain-containing protein [Oscillospiraceae bacterium]